MNERMLNKENKPTVEEMAAYCGALSDAFNKMNAWIDGTFGSESSVVFPYGNHYGWGIAHRKKATLICNVFPENGSFCVMMRLYNEEYQSVYDRVSDYTKGLIDNKYPCSGGGWIHHRIQLSNQTDDVKILLGEKGESANRKKTLPFIAL